MLINKKIGKDAEMKEKLTSEQIKNWRNVLSTLIGIYAFIMTDEQIQMYCDSMQENVDAISNNNKNGE